MTRTLYSVSMNKPNRPEMVIPGKKDYSFRADMKVNAWLAVAMLSSFAGEELLLPNLRDWPALLRTIIALIPLIPSLLWVRSIAKWVRGMDELHRRITQEALLFATVGTLIVVTAWHTLEKVGVIPLSFGFYWRTGFGTLLLFVLFYFRGHFIANRRYQ
jgi:hypothetical protein